MQRSGHILTHGNFQASNALEHKSVLRFAVLIAILNKVFLAYIFTDLEGDKSLYLIMAENFVNTGSLMEPVTLPDGRGTETYPIHLLSPLYILLAIPILSIFDSFELTSLAIDALGWILFFTGLSRVASQIIRSRSMVVLLILCAGFIIYPHQSTSVPKDTLAAGLVLWIISWGYDHLIEKDMSTQKIVKLSLFIILLAISKYLFLPVSIVFLLILIWLNLKGRNRKAFLIFLTTLLGIIAWFIYFRFYHHPGVPPELTTVNTWERDIERTFAPGIIFRTYPFISAAILNLNAFGVQISKISNVSYDTVMNIFRILDIMLILTAVALALRFRKKVPAPYFVFAFLLVFIITYSIMLYLSVTIKVNNFYQAENFTFVAGSRSYFIVMVFIQIYIFLLLRLNNIPKLIQYILSIFILLQSIHGIAFTMQTAVNMHSRRSETRMNSPVKKLVHEAGNIMSQDTTLKFATAIPSLRRYAMIRGIKTRLFLDQSCASVEKMGRPALVAIYKNNSPMLEKCSPKPAEQASFEPFALYTNRR